MYRARQYIAASLFLVSAICAAQSTSQFEISGHYAALSEPYKHSQGLGFQASYDFRYRLGIDAGFTYYPGDNFPYLIPSGNMIDFHIGPRVALVRTERLAIYGRVRPGLLHLSDLRTDFPALPANPPFPPIPAHTIRYGPQTNFAIDIGGTLEYYPTPRTFIRADFGDERIFYGAFSKIETVGPLPILYQADYPEHKEHQYKLSFGAGWRFGSTSTDRRFTGALGDPGRPWTVSANYSALYIDGWRSGAGVKLSRRLPKSIEWDAVANVFPGSKDGSFLWYGQRTLQLQTGPAVRVLRSGRFAMKAHVRPGVLQFGDYLLPSFFGAEHAGAQLEFAFNYGLSAEWNLSQRVPLRLEFSDNLIKHADIQGTVFRTLPYWDHAPQVTLGLGLRF